VRMVEVTTSGNIANTELSSIVPWLETFVVDALDEAEGLGVEQDADRF